LRGSQFLANSIIDKARVGAQVPVTNDSVTTRRIGPSDFGLLAGRICLAADFIYWGSQKFLNPPNIAHVLESAGLPGGLVYPTFTLQILGGLMILVGFQARVAAALLGWFCIVAPSIFWIHAPMNLARDYSAAGGFIILLLFGAGNISCDAILAPRFDILARIAKNLGQSWLDAGSLAARILIALPLITDAAMRSLHIQIGGQVDPAYRLASLPMIVMILAEIVAGLVIALGLRARTAALAILPLWSWSALAFHMPPWRLMADDGLSITKDLTTAGALLILAAHNATANRAAPVKKKHSTPADRA
jgi:putative oxidoreductase